MTLYELSNPTLDFKIRLDGAPSADAHRYMLTDLTGWDDTPDVRNPPQDKTMADGGVNLPQFYSSRTITLKGVAFGASPGEVEAAKATLRVLHQYAVRSYVRFSQIEESADPGVLVTSWGFFKAGGRLRMDAPQGTGNFGWDFVLTGGDPRKYIGGVGVSFGDAPPDGGAPPPSGFSYDEVVNDGNANTYPIVTLNEAGTFDIINTTYGGRVKSSTSLPSGTVIDFKKRSVTGPTGTNYYTAIDPVSVWWSCPPESTSVVQLGEADMTIYTDHAYL